MKKEPIIVNYLDALIKYWNERREENRTSRFLHFGDLVRIPGLANLGRKPTKRTSYRILSRRDFVDGLK